MKNTVLIIGYTFPEPTTTAAGTRMVQLINVFKASGYAITFASTAQVSEKSINLKTLDVSERKIQLNSATFNEFVADLNPTIVLFDRYITEEQFGWRVAQYCPNALRILDTEDLHFLRKARQKAFKETGNATYPDLFTEIAKRELTSILRCDVSLIISKYEMNLLISVFNISKKILCYVPFMVSEIATSNTLPSFNERQDFMTIGNFLHAPNIDSVLFLKKDIWPLIKAKLPNAKLHIYGTYAPQQISELHNQKEGFLIKGWAPAVDLAFTKAKICLAPLRFGAGLKGKLLDAMQYGTPAVTTSIGAEGMYIENSISALIEDTPTTFAEKAILLYRDEKQWLICQKNGFKTLEKKYNAQDISEILVAKIKSLQIDLIAHRQHNFMGQILQHQTLQATKYMSKWIEVKSSK